VSVTYVSIKRLNLFLDYLYSLDFLNLFKIGQRQFALILYLNMFVQMVQYQKRNLYHTQYACYDTKDLLHS